MQPVTDPAGAAGERLCNQGFALRALGCPEERMTESTVSEEGLPQPEADRTGPGWD